MTTILRRKKQKKKPPLPTSVQVGGRVYSVSKCLNKLNAQRLASGSYMMGYTNNRTLEIVVDPEVAPMMRKETLLHEVLHAIADVSGLSQIDSPDEENFIESVDSTLLQVLRDNPALLAYLCG